MHRLDRPSAFDELYRQIIEKLLIARQSPAMTEIIRCRRKSLSEMTLPDSVHHHARGQRIVFADQPLSELQPAAAFCVGRKRTASQHLQKSAGNLGAEIFRIAVMLDFDILRL